MARTRRSRHLQELAADVARLDRESEQRWIARHQVQLDPNGSWRRIGAPAGLARAGKFPAAEGGDLVHTLTGGGFVVLLNGPAGWFIVDADGRTFAPCNDPLPRGARRHDKQVFFDDEDTAKLAADTLPGYWS